jgi:hypothetical protein
MVFYQTLQHFKKKIPLRVVLEILLFWHDIDN